MTNVLVISLDFDMCMDTVKAREWLTQWLIDYFLEHQEMTALEFHLNTARQFLKQDYIMSNEHNKFHKKLFSCSYLEKTFMPEFKAKLNEAFKKQGRIPPTVCFETLLAGDLYNDLTPGTTLSNMSERLYQDWNEIRKKKEKAHFVVKDQNGEEVVLYCSDEKYDAYETKNFIDSSKLLIMYMHLQHIANRMTAGNTYTIKMLDDNPDILKQLKAWFYANPELIPSGFTFQLVPCCLDKGRRHAIPVSLKELDLQKDVICGVGPINQVYQEDILQVIAAVQAAPRDEKRPDVCKIFEALMKQLSVKSRYSNWFGLSKFMDTFFKEKDVIGTPDDELTVAYFRDRC